MRAFLHALQFLTIIPVSSALPENKGINPTVFFPVIGLGIGAVTASLDWALASILPSNVRDVLVVIALIVASGGLHMDGLADSADGFLSTRSKEKILEIMKDGRSGPWAIVTVVCIVLLKFSLVGSLPPDIRLEGIILMPIAGRCAMTLIMALTQYAKTEGGLATPFERGRSIGSAIWSVIFLTAAGWLLSSVPGVLCAVTSIAMAFILRTYYLRRIQGYTGDTLGAACEVVEIVPALTLIALTNAGG